MIKPNKLNFSTAGFPLSLIKNRDVFNAVDEIQRLGLDGMELEFVHSVWLKEKKALEFKEYVKNKELIFTAHASYYVNLASLELPKMEASKKRILDALRIIDEINGYSVTFHAAFYQKQNKDRVYTQVKKQLKEIETHMKEEDIKLWLRPELTGKATQFGDLDELIKLSQELEFVLPCIDFAHLHARYNGRYNTKDEWINVFNKLEKELGRLVLNNMHIHMSGIAYGEKGEKHHLPLQESDFNWQTLLEVFKEYKLKGTIVCESPIIEKDALLMKNFYYKLKK